MRLKVVNEAGLERDADSKAIVNVDLEAYNKYKERKKRFSEKDQALQNMQREITDLREKYDHILSLLANKG